MERMTNFLSKNKLKSLTYCVIRNHEQSEMYLSDGIDEQTMFNACSISKLFRATAILQAKEEGLLELNENINTYIKGWELDGGTVCIEDLLIHQSGLVDSDDSYGTYIPEVGKSSLIELLNGKTDYIKEKIKVKVEPGEKFIYADHNTLILEKILEDIYGEKFREIIQKKILTPLKLNGSQYMDYECLDSANVVLGTDQYGTNIPKEKNIYPYDSVANLWTTTKDLSTLLNELLLAYVGKSEKLLKQKTVQEMFKPHGVVDFTGYGVFVYKNKGRKVFFTQGWGEGFQSYMLGLPEQGDGIVVMMNKNPGVEQMEGPIGEIVRDFLNTSK